MDPQSNSEDPQSNSEDPQSNSEDPQSNSEVSFEQILATYFTEQ